MTSTEQRSDADTFQSCLWNMYGSRSGVDVLEKIRARAWDQFLTKGLPSRENEVFKYIALRRLYAQKYVAPATFNAPKTLPLLPECQEAALVFVNGTFRPDLSKMDGFPKKTVIHTISEAVATYGTFLNSQWSRTLKEETDPFALINLALQNEGLFLYVPPKTVFETPIQIIHLIDAGSDTLFLNPRIQIFVGAQSELTIASTWHHISGSAYVINTVADIAVEDNAHVKIIQSANEFPADAWQFDAIRATQKRQSTFTTIAATRGADTVRQDYRVALVGEGAEASLNGVWMLSGKREAHAHILMDHQAPFCHSMQLFKSVLDDNSRSSFEGKIYVHQAAQKTEAYQLNNNLLLSDNAHADSKPNLEIFADDIKASHGATIGQLDKEQIFYMKTRGYTEQHATQILVHGFCKEVIDMIPIQSLHEKLDTQSSRLAKEKI